MIFERPALQGGPLNPNTGARNEAGRDDYPRMHVADRILLRISHRRPRPFGAEIMQGLSARAKLPVPTLPLFLVSGGNLSAQNADSEI